MAWDGSDVVIVIVVVAVVVDGDSKEVDNSSMSVETTPLMT